MALPSPTPETSKIPTTATASPMPVRGTAAISSGAKQDSRSDAANARAKPSLSASRRAESVPKTAPRHPRTERDYARG